ncbi:DUF4267 domain-containing protein [Streptomyces sp. NPDC048663]|uniref:DUF4267 domain-containing protein n=1 Tax=Streptomyces sp. NPDC048663 TaxID=3155638 RepID=UPI00341DBB8E
MSLAVNVATVLAWATAAGIIFIGVRFLWTPQRAAADFGLSTARDTHQGGPWLAVKGVRDITSGLFLLIGLLGGDSHVLGWMMLAGALTALGDALITKSGGGPRAAYYGIHGGTAVVLVCGGIVLLLS